MPAILLGHCKIHISPMQQSLMQWEPYGNVQFKIFSMISYAVRFTLSGRRRLEKPNELKTQAEQWEGNWAEYQQKPFFSNTFTSWSLKVDERKEMRELSQRALLSGFCLDHQRNEEAVGLGSGSRVYFKCFFSPQESFWERQMRERRKTRLCLDRAIVSAPFSFFF